MKTSPSRIRGFSLIELMVVVFIIGIVAAFVAPAATTILRGSQMTQASQILADQFSLARQYALSKNHPIEVRLIRFADPEVPGEVQGGVSSPANGAYRAIQILERLDGVTTNDFRLVQLDKVQILPQGVVLSKGTFSTLIKDAKGDAAASPYLGTGGASDPAMPRNVGTNYDYVAFHFMPDGSTDLPSQSSSDGNGAWCVTLQSLTDNVAGATPPPNFFTLQVDPVSGAMKQFRPGLKH